MRAVANDPTAKDIKTIGVAVRTGEYGGVIHTSGGVHCVSCGGYLGNLGRIATAIGVPSSALSKWLRRENVRADHANKIRTAVVRVEE